MFITKNVTKQIDKYLTINKDRQINGTQHRKTVLAERKDKMSIKHVHILYA